MPINTILFKIDNIYWTVKYFLLSEFYFGTLMNLSYQYETLNFTRRKNFIQVVKLFISAAMTDRITCNKKNYKRNKK